MSSCPRAAEFSSDAVWSASTVAVSAAISAAFDIMVDMADKIGEWFVCLFCVLTKRGRDGEKRKREKRGKDWLGL